MSQDFYVRLPFYVNESTIARYVSVSFDGEEVIPKTEITSRDIANPNVFEFLVNKEPGIYDMTVSVPDHSFEEEGTVVLKHFFISKDGIQWYEMAYLGINSDQSKVLSISPDEARAPKQCSIAAFWFGDDINFRMEVPADWNLRYPYRNSEEILAFIDSQRSWVVTGSDWSSEIREQALAELTRYENFTKNLANHIANNT